MDRLKKVIATLAVLALSAPASVAASHYVRVSPGSVPRGKTVRVYGSVGTGCARGDQVTIISRAFKGATSHSFAGVPAIYAHQQTNHAFSFKVTIKKTTKKGTYTLSGRCGGGNFGSTKLKVT